MFVSQDFKGSLNHKLRKLALQRCELELLRSHPKDERGSVREIGLWDRMGATLHFLELSPTLWWELTHCSEWSFSGPFWDPERDRKWIPKWTRNGTENGPPKGTLRKDLKDGSLRVEVYEDSKSNLISNLKPKLEVDGRSQGRTRTRPRIPSLAELPLHSSQVTEARAAAVRAGVVAKPSEG